MIKKFVDSFHANRDALKAKFAAKHPDNYEEIVRTVFEIVGDDDRYSAPDPSRIHQIDDGDYQGTLVFVVAASGYQPIDYWYVKVNYGSCSACDTLQDIREYSDERPTEQQINDYMTLALHIVQGIRSMQDDNE